MTVWGAEDVERAGGRLHVSPGDVVTPLARDRARDLGIEIVVASPLPAPLQEGHHHAISLHDGGLPERAAPLGPVPDEAAATGRGRRVPLPPRPPSGALYRRGAPLPAAVRPAAPRSGP